MALGLLWKISFHVNSLHVHGMIDSHTHIHSNPQQQKKQALKKTYKNFLRIFDVLEETLLPTRKEKKRHQQQEKELSTNIAEMNQQLIDNN